MEAESAELCSLWECLWLGATQVERRGRLPYQSHLTQGNALHPPSQFDKYQKSTRNENASNFLRCQGPFVCSVHFAGFSPAFVPLSLSVDDGFWHLRAPHRYRLALARADVGSSHVMLLTATPHLPLCHNPYIDTL